MSEHATICSICPQAVQCLVHDERRSVLLWRVWCMWGGNMEAVCVKVWDLTNHESAGIFSPLCPYGTTIEQTRLLRQGRRSGEERA